MKKSLRNELLDRIHKKLANKKTQEKFIDAYMNIALRCPQSFAAQRMLDIILPADTVERIDELEASRLVEDISLQQFRIYTKLYDKQQNLLNCVGKDKEILAITSRRTGKTTSDCAILCYVCLNPGTHALYVNITMKQAEKQLFDPEQGIEHWAEVAGLKVSKTDKTEGFIYFSNGSFIQYGSNQNKASADKYRGFKYRLIIIDEIGHQSNLDYLLNEVLTPAQADYGDRYTILYTGTPSRVPRHFSTKMFEDENNGIKKFNWSMIDNPFLPNPRQFIEEQCKKKGLSIDSPFIQREYFGKFVADTEALVIPKRTYYDSKENIGTLDGIIIGVDYGYTDNNAIVSVGFNRSKKKAWVLSEDKFNRATVSEVMNKIENVYNEMKKKSDEIVIYADTNEQSITADLRIKRNLPAFNCYKYSKAYAIETLSEVCRNGALSIFKDGVLDQEMEQTLYKRDEDDKIIPEIDDDTFHPDALFALLYAMRRVFHELDYEDVKWTESEDERLWHYEEQGRWRQDENGSRVWDDGENTVII